MLFTVIASSWAILVQAWKAEIVAIYGDRVILGHLRAGLEGRFCRYQVIATARVLLQLVIALPCCHGFETCARDSGAAR